MATVQGVRLVDLIQDAGESAKTLKRSGMERLLSLVDSGSVTVVIIAKLDRLTRSVRDLGHLLERFQKHGVSLVSVAESLDTGTAAGRLVLNIMTSVSQWEREAIGERTRDALQHKRANRERVGTIPYGYRLGADGVHLEPLQSEQRVLTRVREMRTAGNTLREIADALNGEKTPTRRGSPWRREYVHGILKAERERDRLSLSVTKVAA